jgi:hypothetical protein
MPEGADDEPPEAAHPASSSTAATAEEARIIRLMTLTVGKGLCVPPGTPQMVIRSLSEQLRCVTPELS